MNFYVAAGGDILLLQPGSYDEQLTINQPVVLRATPANSFPGFARDATIGRL